MVSGISSSGIEGVLFRPSNASQNIGDTMFQAAVDAIGEDKNNINLFDDCIKNASDEEEENNTLANDFGLSDVFLKNWLKQFEDKEEDDDSDENKNSGKISSVDYSKYDEKYGGKYGQNLVLNYEQGLES